jgi:hypothetical protein
MQTITERPAESVRAIECGLAIQQRERQTSLHALARLRKEARDEIARLIDFLDRSDLYAVTEMEEDEADPSDEAIRYEGRACPVDLEDSEPSLCGVTVNPLIVQGDCVGTFDREQEDEDEVSIGSTTSVNQEHWAHGAGQDLEDEHDGAEPENEHGDTADDEPSLGWTIDGHRGGTDDREAEPPCVHAHRQNRTVIPGADKVRPRPYYWDRALDGLPAAQVQMLADRGAQWI